MLKVSITVALERGAPSNQAVTTLSRKIPPFQHSTLSHYLLVPLPLLLKLPLTWYQYSDF